jgi:hypothetical protein
MSQLKTDTPARQPVATITATVEVRADASFSNVLQVLKAGARATRAHWPSGWYVAAFRPREGDAMTTPYLYINTHSRVEPWTAGNDDLFATDWAVLPG